MSFVQRELKRITAALLDEKDETRKREFYAAQQALCWALDPKFAKAPFNTITGIPAEPEDCSVRNHPLPFSDTCDHCVQPPPPKKISH